MYFSVCTLVIIRLFSHRNLSFYFHCSSYKFYHMAQCRSLAHVSSCQPYYWNPLVLRTCPLVSSTSVKFSQNSPFLFMLSSSFAPYTITTAMLTCWSNYISSCKILSVTNFYLFNLFTCALFTIQSTPSLDLVSISTSLYKQHIMCSFRFHCSLSFFLSVTVNISSLAFSNSYIEVLSCCYTLMFRVLILKLLLTKRYDHEITFGILLSF